MYGSSQFHCIDIYIYIYMYLYIIYIYIYVYLYIYIYTPNKIGMLPVVHPIGYPSPLTVETSCRCYAEKALQDALLGRHESL